MASLQTTRKLANEMLAEHGLIAQGWRFEFDRARERGGVCKHRTKTISMSCILVPLWEDAAILQTLTHEIAHALVGPGEGHGPKWKAQMRAMGATPHRTHENVTVPGRYVATCPTHGEIARMHRLSDSRRQHSACRRCQSHVTWTDTKLAGMFN